MTITYRKFTREDYTQVAPMMKALYTEDPPTADPLTDEKIKRTFEEFTTRPDKGTIIIIEENKITVGYSILINFWSNEYGGNIIDIDELFILPTHRGKKIASDFLKHLINTKYNNAVALELQVSPTNTKARSLYERLGFQLFRNSHMLKKL